MTTIFCCIQEQDFFIKAIDNQISALAAVALPSSKTSVGKLAGTFGAIEL